MEFVLNSGAERILTRIKRYMGDGKKVIANTDNSERFDLRNKPHLYHHYQTMKILISDYHIKENSNGLS